MGGPLVPESLVSPLPEDALVDLGKRIADGTGGDAVIEDVYSLTPLQEGLLFESLAADANDLYVVQQHIEITGSLELEAFQRAWSFVVDRHSALRTIFSWHHPGPPAQVVCSGVEPRIELRDLSGQPDSDATIAAAIDMDRKQGFDLASPLLMRLVLFRLAPDRHQLLWTNHHLIEDGWSASIVLKEVFEAYRRYAAGEQPKLASASPFRDYVAWLAEHGQEGMESFWRGQLRGFTNPTIVSGSHHSESGEGYKRIRRSFTPELSTDVRHLARVSRVSLHALLVTATAILLGRYTNSHDVAVGIVAAGRPPALPGVESIVGLFINTLPLRVEIDEDEPLTRLLGQVHARQGALLEYEHSPLTAVQSWSELGSGVRLTDTLFAYTDFAAKGEMEGGLSYRTIQGIDRTSFPFSVIVDASDPMMIGVQFDPSAADETMANRFLDHFVTLLESMADSPDARVRDLEIAPPEERALVTVGEFNDSEVDVPFGSVVDWFGVGVAGWWDGVALEFGGRVVSYGELVEWSDRLAARIVSLVGIGARVGVFLERSPELLVAVWGVLKSGGAYVPVDVSDPVRRVELLLEDAGVDLVVTNEGLVDRLPDRSFGVVSLPLDQSSDVGDVVLPRPGPDDLAYVMYTSGSTGRPKGVKVTHRGLVNYCWWARSQAWGEGPVDVPLFSSFSFDISVTSLFLPLLTGGRVVIYPEGKGIDLSVVEVFADDRVDVINLTPSHLALLEPHHFELSRIHTLLVGGEDLKTSVAREVVEWSEGRLTVHNFYGPTETTVASMIHRFDPETDTGVSLPLGRPAANTRIYVLDGLLRPVPVGVSGEICIGGDGVAEGYLNRDSLTAEKFVADPYVSGSRLYRTGDVGRWEKPGVLHFLGRGDDQLKIRGYRIELGEIETTLTQNPGISTSAVMVREPLNGDKRLVAYYVLASGSAATVTELRRHLQDQLPAYMVPQHLVEVAKIPLTANGKVDYESLPKTLGRSATIGGYVAPRTPQEKLLSEVCAALLGVDKISLRDNFFDMGGYSLLALQLVSRLEELTGERLSPAVILLNTLEQAAALLPDLGTEGEVAAPSDESLSFDVLPEHAVRSSSPFFFGSSTQALFGIHHVPAASTVRSRAVLICPPIGWEYMRTHRALRNTARMLSDLGFDVLRFDFFGTGDSAGESRDASVGRWVENIRVAAEEARAVASTDHLSIVGLRLGATLASLAVSNAVGAESLVLWDPVVRGRDHLDTLQRMNNELIALSHRPDQSAEQVGDELVGFPYTSELKAELSEIDLTNLTFGSVDVSLIGSGPQPEYQDLVDASSIRYDEVEDAGVWDDAEMVQSALLPKRIPEHIAQLIAGSS